MNLKAGLVSLTAIFALAASAFATLIPKGTEVTLTFDQGLSSSHAKAGDHVRLHVTDDVTVGGKVVIARGTRVTAIISEVHKNGRFGKNGQLKLALNPINDHGVMIELQPRQKGAIVGGSKGTEAAGAAAGGALVLGPVGLAASYFVVGKNVNVHSGDTINTQVARDVRFD